MEQPTEKECRKCGIIKPLSDYSPQKMGKFGVTSRCRECKRIENSEWAKANRSICSEKTRRWREKNPDRVAELAKNSYDRNRRSRIDAVLKCQKAKPFLKKESNSRYRKKNSDKRKLWRRENMGRIRLHGDLRRARKLSATPPWLTSDDISVIQAITTQSLRVSKCSGIKHNVDHIHPLKGRDFCGLHVPWNLRVIPASINYRKGNRLEMEVSN